MTVKQSVGLRIWRIAFWNARARAMAKKILKNPDEERYPDQFKNDYVLKKFKKLMKWIKVDLKVEGFENLPKAPAVLAPNHSSMLDPGFILAALENPSENPDDTNYQPVFLAKDDIAKNKKAKGYAHILSTFFINRDKPREAVQAIDDMTAFAKKNKKFITIFPEGTRTKDGKIDEFKGGAFRSAKKGFMPIVPVTINHAMSSTDTSRKNKITVEVIFHKPIKPMAIVAQDTKSIAAKVQATVNSKYKTQKVKKQNEVETKIA